MTWNKKVTFICFWFANYCQIVINYLVSLVNFLDVTLFPIICNYTKSLTKPLSCNELQMGRGVRFNGRPRSFFVCSLECNTVSHIFWSGCSIRRLHQMLPLLMRGSSKVTSSWNSFLSCLFLPPAQCCLAQCWRWSIAESPWYPKPNLCCPQICQ